MNESVLLYPNFLYLVINTNLNLTQTMKTTVTLIFLLANFLGFAQLRIQSNGTVSIAKTTTTGFSLEVDGYSAIKITYSGSYMRFSSAPANGVISSTADKIAFWESFNGYHELVASSYAIGSDSSLKTNVVPLENGLEKIMLLKPYTYNLKEDVAQGNFETKYGFLAQEVKEVLPDIVDTCMGVQVMDYIAIIPLLVESVQIHQNTIDSLQEKITSLEDYINGGGIGTKSQQSTFVDENGNLIELGQNNPNPFKESTIIPYQIPETSKTAQIIVYDMRGQQLKAYPISDFGRGELVIEGNSFKAGMYMYALLVDGQYIDSKKMILSK